MLERIKLLLNITDTSQDSLLLILINQAITYCNNYTHNFKVDMSTIVEKIVVATYRNNKLADAIIETSTGDSGGIESESYEGASVTYQSATNQMSAYSQLGKLNIPDDALLELNALRKVRFF